jgi:hypothetical protein
MPVTGSPIRYAIYTRQSVAPETALSSCDVQFAICRDVVDARKNPQREWIGERFDDVGASGGKTDRPALQRLMQRVQNREVATVVVYRLDRLTRSLRDSLDILCGTGSGPAIGHCLVLPGRGRRHRPSTVNWRRATGVRRDRHLRLPIAGPAPNGTAVSAGGSGLCGPVLGAYSRFPLAESVSKRLLDVGRRGVIAPSASGLAVWQWPGTVAGRPRR